MRYRSDADRAGLTAGRISRFLVQAAAAILGTIVTLPEVANTQQTTDSAATYPEMARGVVLPVIAHALKNVLIDPASVTNFSICYPAYRVKIKDGKPVRWVFAMLLNSKNSNGGYTGLTTMVAVFEPPKPVNVYASGPPDNKLLARCTHVPDAEIRSLIDAGS